MKKTIIFLLLVFSTVLLLAQGSPLKMMNFHKEPSDIVDLVELKAKAGRDCDFDSNKAALIRVKAQGFNERTMLDFTVIPKPGMEIIYKEFKDGEMWLYVSSNCMGTLVFKYMGEFEFKLPAKLEAKAGYELTLGMETATLVINAVPSNAEIFVDGRKVGSGYASAAISVGSEHRYKVTCENYMPEEDVVKTDRAGKIERQVELRPNFGYVTIKSEPAGAEVYIDDVKVGETPYQMKKIKPGSHVVELRKAGYESYADMVTIKAGEPNRQLEKVRLELVSVPVGTLELVSEPEGAVITVKGRQYGRTPQTIDDFETGIYVVYFSKDGYEELAQSVEVKEGKKSSLNVTLKKTGQTAAAATQQPTAQQQTTQQTTTPQTSLQKPAAAAARGSIELLSTPAGATITLGNKQYGQTPRTLTAEPGTYTFYFSKDGYKDTSKTIEVKSGQKATLNVTMTRIETPQQQASTKPDGKFSVAAGKKVYFAKGNLQYQSSTKTWRFAEHQYDYISNDRKSGSEGWSDYLSWSADGWSLSNVSNGENKTWYVLSKDEWVYVFDKRNTASGVRYVKAKVNNVNGVILLPDDWSRSKYNLNNINTPNAAYAGNVISNVDWALLEEFGAVFLPAAGYYSRNMVLSAGTDGYYWSSSMGSKISYSSGYYRANVFFFDNNCDPGYDADKDDYLSVRMVSDAK